MPEFTSKQREKLADEKEAMPDGSYPIRNRADLKNAIQAFGRSKNPEKTKAWIKRRARELDAEDLIPESWLKHSDDSDYLVHYGVLGMKWGVRKDKNYKYTSMKTKRLTKKAAKAKSQGKSNASKIAAKANASKQSDKNRLSYAKKTSVGKAIGQNLLMGPIGALSYQKMRANGTSRGKAALVYSLSMLVGGAAGGLVSGTAAGLAGNALANSIVAQVNAGTLTAEQATSKLLAQLAVTNTASAAAGNSVGGAITYAPGSRATTKSSKKKTKK